MWHHCNAAQYQRPPRIPAWLSNRPVCRPPTLPHPVARPADASLAAYALGGSNATARRSFVAADSSGNRYVVVVAMAGSFVVGTKTLTATTQSILVFRYPPTSYSNPTWAVNLMVRSCALLWLCVFAGLQPWLKQLHTLRLAQACGDLRCA